MVNSLFLYGKFKKMFFRKLMLIYLIIMFGVKASEDNNLGNGYLLTQIKKLFKATSNLISFNARAKVPVKRDYLILMAKDKDNNLLVKFFALEKLIYSKSLQNILLNKEFEFLYASNQKVDEKINQFNLQRLECFVEDNQYVFQLSEKKFIAFALEGNFHAIEASIISNQQLKKITRDIYVISCGETR